MTCLAEGELPGRCKREGKPLWLLAWGLAALLTAPLPSPKPTACRYTQLNPALTRSPGPSHPSYHLCAVVVPGCGWGRLSVAAVILGVPDRAGRAPLACRRFAPRRAAHPAP